ncbi:hypothetical protein [Clostridium estertheticum]|uniref:Uncharacterized protein n=1 Tax=Clostridium estertheticum TaxID=238834 RepID=A0AA47I4N1_9CLOT|nr:hypothetical protein [Clostridium estertheticum]MBU3157789.1 hypothetical protein [Clostridium estertheticum]WAG59437.1 hypothetical protein LL038_17590 [Clostridium estertheticum]
MSYILTTSITNNINNTSLNKFLSKNKSSKGFMESGESYENYIAELINSGRISFQTFNDYLFEEFSYGKQRETFIFKIHSFNKKIKNIVQLIEIMKSNYNVDETYYNKIATTYFSNDDEKAELVAFKIVPNFNNVTVSKIKLLFGYKVEVLNKDDKKQNEHSYVAVEVDLDNKSVVIKVSPKARVIHDRHKPESLFRRYKEKVFALFNINIDAFNYDHKVVLYTMCEELYSQIYRKMVSIKPVQVDTILDSATKELTKTLKILDIDIKKTQNNIFDIKSSLVKLVEHLLISDIIYTRKSGEEVEGVDGFVTYLRFNDGTNVSARLRGENCRDPIFDSETYMALRSPIDNSKKISILQVLWLSDEGELRIGYDTNSAEFLNIHFFSNLSESDFDYGYGKYTKYEQAPISKVSRMDKADASIASE